MNASKTPPCSCGIRLATILALLLLVPAPGARAADEPPAYTVIRLPELVTPAGELDTVLGLGINNLGQVAGVAWDSASAGPAAAFRYTPGIGMEDCHPAQTHTSIGFAINEAGDVYGQTYGADFTRKGFFLYHDATDWDFLKKKVRRALQAQFMLGGMNEAGDLVGTLVQKDLRLVAYRYTDAEGWTNLAGLHPSFRRGETTATAINEHGDILLVYLGPGSWQTLEVVTYLVLGGEQLFRLPDLGGPYTEGLALNDAGRVVGVATTADYDLHAFVYTLGERMVDLHRPRFTFSLAGAVSSEGVVGGIFAKSAPDTLFTYDERRSRKLQVMARRVDFRALSPAGAEYRFMDVMDMNERLEFVGRVVESDENDDVIVRHFYCGPSVGVLDLAQLLSAAGSELEIDTVVDINDQGEILLWVREGRKDGTVILSPEAG